MWIIFSDRRHESSPKHLDRSPLVGCTVSHEALPIDGNMSQTISSQVQLWCNQLTCSVWVYFNPANVLTVFVSNHLTAGCKLVGIDRCDAAGWRDRRTSATSEFIVLHGFKPFESCILHHLSPTPTRSVSSWATKSVVPTELQEVYRSSISGSWLERC